MYTFYSDTSNGIEYDAIFVFFFLFKYIEMNFSENSSNEMSLLFTLIHGIFLIDFHFHIGFRSESEKIVVLFS